MLLNQIAELPFEEQLKRIIAALRINIYATECALRILRDQRAKKKDEYDLRPVWMHSWVNEMARRAEELEHYVNQLTEPPFGDCVEHGTQNLHSDS